MASIGFEEKLWQAADKLRGSMKCIGETEYIRFRSDIFRFFYPFSYFTLTRV